MAGTGGEVEGVLVSGGEGCLSTPSHRSLFHHLLSFCPSSGAGYCGRIGTENGTWISTWNGSLWTLLI